MRAALHTWTIGAVLSRALRLAFLAEFADTPALVLGTHFAGRTGRITRDGDSYAFSMS